MATNPLPLGPAQACPVCGSFAVTVVRYCGPGRRVVGCLLSVCREFPHHLHQRCKRCRSNWLVLDGPEGGGL